MTVNTTYTCDDPEHDGENGEFEESEVKTIELRYQWNADGREPFVEPDRRVMHICDTCADRRRVSEASLHSLDYVAVDMAEKEAVGMSDGSEWMKKGAVTQTPYDKWVFEAVEDAVEAGGLLQSYEEQ